MVRAAHAHVRWQGMWWVLVTLLAGLLLLAVEGIIPEPVEAGSPARSAAAIRERQARAERAMRRADQQIRRLQRLRSLQTKRLHHARQRLERADARRATARRAADRAHESLATERAVRDRRLRVHPSPTGRQLADQPRLRKRVTHLQARVEHLEDRLAKLQRQVEHARQVRQANARQAGRPRLEARKKARERAEAVLGGQISRMLPLAKERADLRASSKAPRGFRQPTRGYVSQSYGCQQATHRPRHGRSRCGHFHDGIDIAAARGAKVRASADGYVAYVGWNPWDRGRRSFVVIIGHARGFETIYGHMRPGRKVGAGQRVRRGDVIGVVGVTGHTSGPHVHWEVSRDFQAVDPRRAGR